MRVICIFATTLLSFNFTKTSFILDAIGFLNSLSPQSLNIRYSLLIILCYVFDLKLRGFYDISANWITQSSKNLPALFPPLLSWWFSQCHVSLASFRFQWCFRLFPLALELHWMFLLFPLNVFPVVSFRFCEKLIHYISVAVENCYIAMICCCSVAFSWSFHHSFLLKKD